MKIIIRFCSQWGNISTKSYNLNKGCSVVQLKSIVQDLTDIEVGEQELYIIMNGHKIQLEDQNSFQSYKTEEGVVVYVNQKDSVEQIEQVQMEQSSIVSQRYFTKLGIIQEEQSMEYDMGQSQFMSFNNNKRTRPYKEILGEFIKFIKQGNWEGAYKVYQAYVSQQTTVSSNPSQFSLNVYEQDLNSSQTIVNQSPFPTHDIINDNSISGWNALHHASYLGYDNIVKELINLKADINITTRDGWSPLQLAVQKNHTSVYQQLLDRIELDVGHQSHSTTALDIAARKGYQQALRSIINHPNFKSQQYYIQQSQSNIE